MRLCIIQRTSASFDLKREDWIIGLSPVYQLKISMSQIFKSLKEKQNKKKLCQWLYKSTKLGEETNSNTYAHLFVSLPVLTISPLSNPHFFWNYPTWEAVWCHGKMSYRCSPMKMTFLFLDTLPPWHTTTHGSLFNNLLLSDKTVHVSWVENLKHIRHNNDLHDILYSSLITELQVSLGRQCAQIKTFIFQRGKCRDVPPRSPCFKKGVATHFKEYESLKISWLIFLAPGKFQAEIMLSWRQLLAND